MKKTRLSVGRHPVSIFTPAFCGNCSVVYIYAADEEAEAVAKLQDDAKFILVAVNGVDWDDNLSPWPAPKAFRNGNDFSGGADAYLKELTEDIVPAVEAKLGFTPRSRMIAGYSLAGLFALYALYRTDIFSRAASMSGSLWYDGFLGFMEQNSPMRLPEKVYFSLGDRESKIKNRRFAAVEECTVKAYNLMQSLGTNTLFEWNTGNHYVNVPERIAKGLKWISV